MSIQHDEEIRHSLYCSYCGRIIENSSALEHLGECMVVDLIPCVINRSPEDPLGELTWLEYHPEDFGLAGKDEKKICKGRKTLMFWIGLFLGMIVFVSVIT